MWTVDEFLKRAYATRREQEVTLSLSLSLSNVDSCCPWDFFLSNVSNVNNVISEIYRFRLAGRTLSCTPSQRRKQIEMLGRKIYWSFYFLFLPSRPLGLTSNNSICYTPLPPRHPSAENVPVLVMRCWWVCVCVFLPQRAPTKQLDMPKMVHDADKPKGRKCFGVYSRKWQLGAPTRLTAPDRDNGAEMLLPSRRWRRRRPVGLTTQNVKQC